MSAQRARTAGSRPDFAAILTWFVPGAGHVYLGRPLFGLLAFLLVEGLYFLGTRLSDGRLFEFLEPDLQSSFAGGLSPEVGNLGALVWQMKTFGFGPGIPRPWPMYIHLGSWLTAASGLLNACLMIHAHLQARCLDKVPRASLRPALLVLAGWIVPGLGHLLQRRIARAVAVFLLLVGLFVLGTALAGGSNLDRERHFYYWGGQFLLGAPAMVAEALHGHARITRDLPYVDAGLVMACLAGLLNVLALLDVFGQAEARALQAAPVLEGTDRAPARATT
jgi:TM2 domain-containing membrane protein YozV